MGRNAHGAYKRTCNVYANHEQPVSQYVHFWNGSVSGWHPCVLTYSEGTLHATRENTGVLTSVYVLL